MKSILIKIVSINSFGPFDSDVWGTVSDWVMVIVTALTALFIFKTFRAQLKVNKDQAELLNIERIKLREQFKTEIAISGGNTWVSVNTVWLNIKTVNHNAYNIKISNVPAKLSDPNKRLQFELLKIENWENIIEKVVEYSDLKSNYNILLKFEDENDIKYSQTISGTFEFPVISRPRVISS